MERVQEFSMAMVGVVKVDWSWRKPWQELWAEVMMGWQICRTFLPLLLVRMATWHVRAVSRSESSMVKWILPGRFFQLAQPKAQWSWVTDTTSKRWAISMQCIVRLDLEGHQSCVQLYMTRSQKNGRERLIVRNRICKQGRKGLGKKVNKDLGHRSNYWPCKLARNLHLPSSSLWGPPWVASDSDKKKLAGV